MHLALDSSRADASPPGEVCGTGLVRGERLPFGRRGVPSGEKSGAHTVLGAASSTASSTASAALRGLGAPDASPARLSWRSGYHVVNATRLTLIGQPATVSAIRYSSSGNVANSHSRTTARSVWPHNHAAEATTNARRNVRVPRTLCGIGYSRWANSANSGRPSSAEPKNAEPYTRFSS